MRRAKIDHEMAIEKDGVAYNYPADTVVEVLTDKIDTPDGEYVKALFPDGMEWGVPDHHLRKWIVEDGRGYWLKSFHDIEAGEIIVTVVDADGERTTVMPPTVEHL